MNYLSYIPFQWKFTYGFGSNIGIIDAGFDVNNIYIKQHITQFKDFGHTNIDHGTHVMGIMCLNTSKTSVINSFAPKSNYYIASVPIGDQKSVESIINALQWMSAFNIDVINMSFTAYSENKRFKQLLMQYSQNNTIIIASYSKELLYPHIYPFVISAGYDLIVPDHFVSSISNNQFKDIRGTSMQAAFISSVASIAKAYNKKINKNDFIKTIIGETMIYANDLNMKNQISIKL